MYLVAITKATDGAEKPGNSQTENKRVVPAKSSMNSKCWPFCMSCINSLKCQEQQQGGVVLATHKFL